VPWGLQQARLLHKGGGRHPCLQLPPRLGGEAALPWHALALRCSSAFPAPTPSAAHSSMVWRAPLLLLASDMCTMRGRQCRAPGAKRRSTPATCSATVSAAVCVVGLPDCSCLVRQLLPLHIRILG
jgi:hypothetical protein